MRIFYIIILLLLSFKSSISFAQNSDLYTPLGQLIVDSTFTVTDTCLKKLTKIEFPLLEIIYNNTEYPRIASSNGIEGIVIAKIIISDTEINVQIVKSVSPILSSSFEKTLYDVGRYIIDLCKIEKNTTMQFYVPIEFKLLNDNFRNTILNNNSIVLKSSAGSELIESIGISSNGYAE